ncbi:hypothetical protein YC2023_095031 [Brassica napus]
MAKKSYHLRHQQGRLTGGDKRYDRAGSKPVSPFGPGHQPRKSSSTQAFRVIILLLFFIVILLDRFCILSLLSTSRSSSRPIDLTTVVRDSEESRESYGNEDGNGGLKLSRESLELSFTIILGNYMFASFPG